MPGIIRTQSLISLAGGGGGGSVMDFVTEPTGGSWVTIEDFACDGYPGIGSPYGNWEIGDVGEAPYDNEIDILDDPTAPKPTGSWGTKIFRTIFRTNLPAGSGPIDLVRKLSAGERKKKLWIGAIMRHVGEALAPGHGWQQDPFGTGKAGTKQFWFSPYPYANSAVGHFYSSFDNQQPSTTTMLVNFAQQDQLSGGNPMGLPDRLILANANGNVYPKVAGSEWYRWEALLQTNSADGVADGIIQTNINTSQVIGISDLRFDQLNAVNPTRGWQFVRLNQTFGGQGSSPAHDQYQEYSFIRMKVSD